MMVRISDGMHPRDWMPPDVVRVLPPLECGGGGCTAAAASWMRDGVGGHRRQRIVNRDGHHEHHPHMCKLLASPSAAGAAAEASAISTSLVSSLLMVLALPLENENEGGA